MARFLVLLMISVLVLTNQVTAEPSEFEAFKRNVEERLQITEKQLLDTTVDLKTTQQNLQNTKQVLQTTQQDLQTTQQVLQTTQQDLQNTKQVLQTTQQDQQNTQLRLFNTEADLQTTKQLLNNTLGSKDLLSDFDNDNKMESTLGVVAFSVHRNNDVYQGGSVTAPIPFEVIDYVIGPGYDTVTSVFTAPVGGLYFFAASLRDDDAVMRAYITINGINWRYANSDNEWETVSSSGVAQLQAGDTVSVDLAANDYIYCINNGCHFDGYLLYEQL